MDHQVYFKTENQLINEGILSRRPEKYTREYKPKRLVLQWHITERCNLNCLHCYQNKDSISKELSLDVLKDIFHQYIELIKKWDITGQINLTGGEPFIREDIFELLEYLYMNKEFISFGILSNGLLIDPYKAKELSKLGCKFVQVSLDGGKKTNDRIRGEGNFERVIKALKILKENGIRTSISFSASNLNYKEFPIVAEAGRKYGAQRVWADRIIPSGNGESLKDEIMQPYEVEEFFEIMYSCRLKQEKHEFESMSIPLQRALNFIILHKHEPYNKINVYRCTAGDTLITIMPDGNLLPCRRMPIVVGNVLEKSIEELYYSSELFNQLRNRSLISEGCEECKAKDKCGGGLRCLSYAFYGTPFKADPQCFLINKNL